MNLNTLTRAVTVAALSLLCAVSAPSARADDVIATDSTEDGFVIAVEGSGSGRPSSRPRATASLPRGIVVTSHGGKPVSLFAEGQSPLRRPRPGTAPATFTGLKAGTTYTVVVGGRSIGRVVAINRPRAATRLVVSATGDSDTVSLAWRYRAQVSTGGRAVTFRLSATSRSAPPVTINVKDARRVLLPGLDPHAIYTFSVRVDNTAGHSRLTSATMTTTLAELAGPTVAAVPTPPDSPPVLVTPITPPPPPPPPATKTIYVCPTDYVENSSGTCTRTLAYTFHQEQSGPRPLLNSFETTSPACPAGYSLEDYGWVMYCRSYGPVPITYIKDPPPAGFTDNGTAWVRTVPKDAVTVPA